MRSSPVRLLAVLLAVGVVLVVAVPLVLSGGAATLAPIAALTSPPTPTVDVEKLVNPPLVLYQNLARNTEAYEGQYVQYIGKVAQVIEDDTPGAYALRVYVKSDGGNWDDLLMVLCLCQFRPLEDDIISFKGKVEGRMSYETVLGATITVPQVLAYDVQMAE